MTKVFRPGPLGSLFDLYERALNEFIEQLNATSKEQYERIAREKARGDFKSIQTTMRHVIESGYGYANYIRTEFGMKKSTPKIGLISQAEAIEHLRKMFAYSLDTFNDRWSMTYRELLSYRIETSWGQHFDMESLLEHAICHLSRHARMMEIYRQE